MLATIGWMLWWALRGFPDERIPWAAAAVAAALVLVVAWPWVQRPWWRLRAALRRSLGLARGVGRLAKRLGLPEAALRGFSPAYRVARVPKRSGGTRVLHVPSDETKSLQRRILWRVLAGLEAHSAAYGFERARSIAHHAAQHVGRAVVLHFDVVDFFPTTRAGRVERMFLRLGWDREAATLLTRLVTHEGGLPQGAPTSPRLSNLVNAGLDRDLTGRLAPIHGRYTRYADDITVSFPADWSRCVERTKARVREELGRRGYAMHERRKLSVRRRHERQVVTGLVVNEKVALPRWLRRRLRAARHHIATGREATWTAEQLRGWAALESMIRTQGAVTPIATGGEPPRKPPRGRRRRR